MCGLIGGVGELNLAKHREAINMMLIFDVVRGKHSTGMAFVNKAGDINVQKKLGNPFELLDSIGYEKQYDKYDNWVMMGHNRWATKGKINKRNAHPFEFDNVVGAHNGTLRDVTPLKDHKDFEVDSENVMWNVEQEGLTTTLPKLRGAYALTIYDAREKALFLARNPERTLFYCFTKDNKTLFWASEQWMLEVALSRCSIEHNPVQPLKEGVLMKIDRSGEGGSIKTYVRNFEMYKAPVVAVGKGRDKVEFTVDGTTKSIYGSSKYIVGTTLCEGQHEVRIHTPEGGPTWNKLLSSMLAFRGDVTSTSFNGKEKILYVLHTTLSEVEFTETEEPVFYAHPSGKILTSDEWKKLCDAGCAWCHRLLNDDDEEEMGLYLEEVVCPQCAKDLKVA